MDFPGEISSQLLNGLFTILGAIAAAMVAHYLNNRGDRRSTIPHDQTIDGSGGIISAGENSDALSISRVYLGFLIAILAAFFWGAGNVVTRYTLEQYPDSNLEISILQYFSAAITIMAFALFNYVQNSKAGQSFFDFDVLSKPITFAAAAFFKGVNTYTWIASVAFVAAGISATLENLHVIWTAILLSLFARAVIPGSWFTSGLIVIAGAALILEVGTDVDLSGTNRIGFALATISGITFSLFAFLWNQVGEKAEHLWQRAFGMSLFFIASCMMIVVAHLLLGNFLPSGNSLEFEVIPMHHLVIQFLNGIIHIGLTYFFINESLRLMRSAGSISALLLGLGISFAVLFTLLTEAIWLREPISLLQWIGIFLFSVGFASVRSNMLTKPLVVQN